MKLYFTATSPFVRKALVLAHERGLAADLELVTLRPSPLETNAELSRVNPLNKIPALVLGDGTCLYDSAVICEYLDGIGGAPRLIPASGPERWRVLRQQALADGVLEAGISAFYERTFRPEDRQFRPWAEGQLQKVRQGLDALDAESVRFGEVVDLGMVCAAVAVGWLAFRAVVEPLEGRASLARWYGAFAERASMRATVPRA